jgi:ketosteroid isomerase-like protein
MSGSDLELARRFLAALETVAAGGDKALLYPFLADDIEWTMPQRTLVGIDAIRDDLTWAAPHERLEVEFGPIELVDAGDGRIHAEAQETYTMKRTGELAYTRDRRVDLTIHDGRVTRYEMRIVG